MSQITPVRNQVYFISFLAKMFFNEDILKNNRILEITNYLQYNYHQRMVNYKNIL